MKYNQLKRDKLNILYHFDNKVLFCIQYQLLTKILKKIVVSESTELSIWSFVTVFM